MSEIDEQSKHEAIDRLTRDVKFLNGELVLLNQDRKALRANYQSLQEECTQLRETIERLRNALAGIVALPDNDPNSLRCIAAMKMIARKALAWPTDTTID